MKSFEELIIFLKTDYEEDVEDAIGEKYLAWAKLDVSDKSRLTKVISLSDLNFKKREIFCLNDYWSTDFPIDLAVYPNSESDIFSDERSGNYFMVYREFGGHAPEERCRLIQKKLIRYDPYDELG